MAWHLTNPMQLTAATSSHAGSIEHATQADCQKTLPRDRHNMVRGAVGARATTVSDPPWEASDALSNEHRIYTVGQPMRKELGQRRGGKHIFPKENSSTPTTFLIVNRIDKTQMSFDRAF